MTPASRKRYASERRMERERDMRAKEAKTGVAHEASSRREGGTVRPDRRERVRKSASASYKYIKNAQHRTRADDGHTGYSTFLDIKTRSTGRTRTPDTQPLLGTRPL